MLKFQIDKLEDVEETQRDLYEKDGEKYKLKVEGLPASQDTAGLERKVEELLTERKRDQEKREAAEKKAKEAEIEAAKKAGDVEALEKSWEEKLTRVENEYRAKLEEAQGAITGLTSGQEATRIAAELAAVINGVSMSTHLERILERRLKTEIRDGRPTTVVLDKDGKPSAMTVEELKVEVKSDPSNAPLISGSKADGPGTFKGAENPGGQDLTGLSPQEKMEIGRAQAQNKN